MAGRAPHLDPSLILVVFAGGVVGTGARYGISTALAPSSGWPTATFVENLTGAFLLGMLLELLVRRGAETPRGRRIRLGLGTGVLGGYTTFSTLALEVERLVGDGQVPLGLGYGLASVVLGFGAALLGVVLGARLHRRRALRRDAGGAS